MEFLLWTWEGCQTREVWWLIWATQLSWAVLLYFHNVVSDVTISTIQMRKWQLWITTLPQIMKLAYREARLESYLSSHILEDDSSFPFKTTEDAIFIPVPISPTVRVPQRDCLLNSDSPSLTTRFPWDRTLPEVPPILLLPKERHG